MNSVIVWAAASLNPHRGAVLPAARVVIILIPMLALSFYVFVVRAKGRR